MNKLITKYLYTLLAIASLSFVSANFFNFSVFTLLKYILLFAFAVLVLVYMRNHPLVFRFDVLTKLVLAMLVIIVIPGSIFSSEIEMSLFRGILAILVFVTIFGTIGILGSKKVISILFNFFIYVSVIVIILTDFLLLTGDVRAFHMGNLRSFFANANAFGTLVALFFLPALIYKILVNSKSKVKYIYVLIFIHLLILFWFIRSRSALLSFTVFLSLFIYVKYFVWHKKRIRNVTLAFSILTILGIALVSNASVQNYLSSYFFKYEYLQKQAGYSVVSTRAQLWSERIEGIEEKPLTGWGYGVNSIDYLRSNYIPKGITEKGNSALSILEEFGLFFGLLLIFIIGVIVTRLLVTSKRNLQNSELFLIVSSLLIASLVHVNFESWLLFFGNPNAMFFWYLLVAAIHFPKEKETIRRSE